mmetsp:Transcript_7439/g.18711  ORF Transcript_7439/g.18711 Transcript_7439/m.18711 type:complete len:288 (+) Transcript_7439:221-1084(+)
MPCYRKALRSWGTPTSSPTTAGPGSATPTRGGSCQIRLRFRGACSLWRTTCTAAGSSSVSTRIADPARARGGREARATRPWTQRPSPLGALITSRRTPATRRPTTAWLSSSTPPCGMVWQPLHGPYTSRSVAGDRGMPLTVRALETPGGFLQTSTRGRGCGMPRPSMQSWVNTQARGLGTILTCCWGQRLAQVSACLRCSRARSSPCGRSWRRRSSSARTSPACPPSTARPTRTPRSSPSTRILQASRVRCCGRTAPQGLWTSSLPTASSDRPRLSRRTASRCGPSA